MTRVFAAALSWLVLAGMSSCNRSAGVAPQASPTIEHDAGVSPAPRRGGSGELRADGPDRADPPEAEEAEDGASPPIPTSWADVTTTGPSAHDPQKALDALRKRHWIPAGYPYRVIQRRPWVRGSILDGAKRIGELFELVGLDTKTGDQVLLTLGKAEPPDARDRAAFEQPGEADTLLHVFVNQVPEQPSAPKALGKPAIDEPGWYLMRRAHRRARDVTPVRRWLERHPTPAALDVALITPYRPDDDEFAEITVVHHLAKGVLTICAIESSTRCWTRTGVRSSAAMRTHADDFSFELVPESSAETAERWEIDEQMELHSEEELDDSAWTPRSSVPRALSRLVRSGRRLSQIEPGIVEVGGYEVIGHATEVRTRISQWLLVLRGGRWSPVALPDLILEEVVALGDALGVVESRSVVFAGGFDDSLRLLVFGQRGSRWLPLGQLPPVFGEREGSPMGDYSWTHGVVMDGPDCVTLAPGSSTGMLFDPEDDSERPVAPLTRARFAAVRGPWTIGADGLKPGCARTKD